MTESEDMQISKIPGCAQKNDAGPCEGYRALLVEYIKLETEKNRLRKENARLRQVEEENSAIMPVLISQAIEAQAEIVRLREALETIGSYDEKKKKLIECGQLARAALRAECDRIEAEQG